MSHLITSGRYAGLIAKSNNQAGNLILGITAGPGLVISLGALSADIIHSCPAGGSFYVTKIMWYQATGANVTLNFETLSNAPLPLPVVMFPTQLAITGMPGGLTEDELTGVEFMLNSDLVAGWDGNLIVTATLAGVVVAGVQISAELAEKA